MCLIHKWGKWEQYEVEIPARQISKNYRLIAKTEIRQKRICQKCGKIKIEIVGDRPK